MAVRLAQIFDVFGEFQPTKASLYLKRVGQNDTSEYLLSDELVVIDATNFTSLIQNDSKLLWTDSEGSTGNGAMKTLPVSGSTGAMITFPIKADVAGKYNIAMRVRSGSGIYRSYLYIDGVQVIEAPMNTPGDIGWTWIVTQIVLPDTLSHVLGIVVEGTSEQIDKICISSETITGASGTGPAYTLSPYVTLHLRLYDSSNNLPDNALNAYDWKTTLDEVKADDWYNFRLRMLDEVEPTLNERCALVMSASGGSNTNYVIWELVDNDEYTAMPSAIKVT